MPTESTHDKIVLISGTIRIMTVLILSIIGGIVSHTIIPGLMAIVVFLTREILLSIITGIGSIMPLTNLNAILFVAAIYILLMLEIIAYTTVVVSIF